MSGTASAVQREDGTVTSVGHGEEAEISYHLFLPTAPLLTIPSRW
jgi:hypothetical protein